jgi:general secretion pathway protein K
MLKINPQQQGMALILVLWMLTLLTIMAGSFTLSMRREASVISSSRDTAIATAIAEAGITLAEKMLLSTDKQQRWKTDGSIYQLGFVGAAVRIQVFNERGKIDINMSNQQQLKNLLAYAGIEEQQQSELVDAILDWRDSNDLVRINGAESRQYDNEGLQYQPRNKPFQTIDELQMVLGMNEEIFTQIEPLITIYSKQKTVDKNSASQAVLMVISNDDDSFQLNDEPRSNDVIAIGERPNNSGPDEDVSLSNLLYTIDEESQPTGNRGPGGNTFTIVTEAKLQNGAKSMIKAIIRYSGSGKPGQPFDILNWKRMQINDTSMF